MTKSLNHLSPRARRHQRLMHDLVLLLLLILLLLPGAKSQSLDRQLIGSLGMSTTSPAVSSSVGEAVVSSQSKGSILLTQGFQQTRVDNTINLPDYNSWQPGIEVFPNPTSSILYLSLSSGSLDTGPLNLKLYDSSGQLALYRDHVLIGPGTQYAISVDHLNAGVYFLSISNPAIQSNIQIIKTQ